MPYAQIDIGALRHPKILGLSDAAFRLWVAGLAYCQEHLTDGALPAACLTVLGVKTTPKLVTELTAGKLWDVNPEGGYTVHDYLAWNKSRDSVERRREESRERIRLWRERNAARNALRAPARNAERTRDVPYAYAYSSSGSGSSEGEPEGEPPPSDPAHTQHAFCGSRFCVPKFLDAEFRAGIGPEALDRYDLDVWYRQLDDEAAASGGPLLPDPKRWLQDQFREVLRTTFGDATRRLRRVR